MGRSTPEPLIRLWTACGPRELPRRLLVDLARARTVVAIRVGVASVGGGSRGTAALQGVRHLSWEGYLGEEVRLWQQHKAGELPCNGDRQLGFIAFSAGVEKVGESSA